MKKRKSYTDFRWIMILEHGSIVFRMVEELLGSRVNIIQYGDAEPVANVTLQEGKSEGQSLGGFWELQDKFSQSYSVIERTDSNYVLFSGGNYYETTEAGTALIDELLAGITLTE